METSKTKEFRVALVTLVVFGFLLRLINVNTRVLLGDPPHLALHAKNFLSSGLLIVWDQSAYLWYAVTDIFYKIFGVTQFGSRFSSLLFGTLSILAIYLFALEFSRNKRIAFFSSILFAFAPVFVWHSADEHDISVLFFIIITFYTLIKGLNNKSKIYLLSSALLFGVSCMWKAYVPILIVPYVGLMLLYAKLGKFEISKNYKLIFFMIAIVFITISPNLVYNYLNYKHNGVVDFLYATHFDFLQNEKMENLYGWTLGGEFKDNSGFFYKLFIDGAPDNPENNKPNIVAGVTYSLYSNGHLLFVIILLSFLYSAYRRKEIFCKNYLIFYALYFFVPFILLVNGNLLNKHYVHFFAFALPIIAFTLDDLYIKYLSKYSLFKSIGEKKFISVYFIVVVFLFSFFIIYSQTSSLAGTFFSKNPEGLLMKYESENILPDSLVVYDDRIYNSAAGWMFNDRNYIPVSHLKDLLSLNENSPSKTPIDIYFIECVPDDCGWGTVAQNQQLNSSMEEFFIILNNQSIPVVKEINAKISSTIVKYDNPLISKKPLRRPEFKIYKATLAVDINLLKAVKKRYEYFLYPSGYQNLESETFKNFIYTPRGAFEISINALAWLIFYLNILISFLTIIYLFYELQSSEKS